MARELSRAAIDAREQLVAYFGLQRANRLGPANLELFERVRAVLSKEPAETPEPILIALANAVRGVQASRDIPPAKDKTVSLDERALPLDERALAVFLVHTDWTKKRIAEHLGANPKSLAPERCPKLDAAVRAFKAKPTNVRGYKDAEGEMDAWEG